ncbi:hypothetical protein CpecA_0441 [Chlamydia pecorum IPTaLE]|nr:hypothetical protein CpecA_0441 [Chlamydia pecorum IPTaLE]
MQGTQEEGREHGSSKQQSIIRQQLLKLKMQKIAASKTAFFIKI